MRKQKGFTLVELVVVVMILGILAAVAAPKLLGTSSIATDNSLKQTLAVVRDAIERYAADHGGSLPTDPTTDLVTYLRGEFPVCPVGKMDRSVKISTDDANITGETITSTSKSWHYDSTTGQFICNSNAATKSDASKTYDTL